VQIEVIVKVKLAEVAAYRAIVSPNLSSSSTLLLLL